MDPNNSRKFIIIGLFSLIGLLFVLRLFGLQVLDESYKTQASDVGSRIIYPARGLIYDRTGQLIVNNKPIYDILVIQRNVSEVDTGKFCALLGITIRDFRDRMTELRENRLGYYSRYKPEIFISQVDANTIAQFKEHQFKYPGFYTQVRVVRGYPFNSGAHVLGDIGRIDMDELRQEDAYYKPGDYIGKSGLEKQYEKSLRGKKGIVYFLKDKLGRDIGSFQNGFFDSVAIAGKNMVTTLDMELQAYGEKLMQGKKGGIVAIEPATGEILALISSPGYDPNLLVGRSRGDNFRKLAGEDSEHSPLFNRAIKGMYAPGSTVKPLNALISLSENAITQDMSVDCRGQGFIAQGIRVGCHAHSRIRDVESAIQHSCNAWFCETFRRMIEHEKFKNENFALNRWAQHYHDFGLGRAPLVDLPEVGKGIVPNGEYYDKMYPNYRWRSLTIISLGIGQGELLTTPLQLANLYTVFANKGFYFEPHLVRSLGDGEENEIEEQNQIVVDVPQKYFQLINDGLEKVVSNGTGRMARVDSLVVCGKTGTAENPHGEDHSMFTAFAPRIDPQIAIAVVVENAGFGGTWAAPIAGLMIEKYIKGKISSKKRWIENRILKSSFLEKKEDDSPDEEEIE